MSVHSSGANAPPSDTHAATKLGLWGLSLGLGGFLLWAAMAPLDEGVPTHGMVTLDSKRKAVQHLSGGLVQAVMVREGQLVSHGQVLFELDENTARANREAVRQRYLSLRAMQGRLQAEQAGQSAMQLHPDLQAARSDPLIASQIVTQQQLLLARRAALAAELAALDDATSGQMAAIQSYQAVLVTRKRQASLLSQELAQIAPLVAEGYAPRNRLLELERLVADSAAQQAELAGQVSRAQLAVAEHRQRKLAIQQNYRKEVESQMADVTRDVQADAEKMVAVDADLSRMQIRSPAAGQVVGLAIQSVGAVVQPGQKLMDIVPEDEPLMLETRIDPHLIDKVRAGLHTDVRFSSFSQTPQLVVQGEVVSVSQDLLVDPQTGLGYYLGRVRITPTGLAELGKRQLQPGMPAEIIVKTGERTLLTYLLNPLSKRVAASLKEE